MNDLSHYLASHLAVQRGGSVFDPENLEGAGRIIGAIGRRLGVRVLATSPEAFDALGELLNDTVVNGPKARVKLPAQCREAVMDGVRSTC